MRVCHERYHSEGRWSVKRPRVARQGGGRGHRERHYAVAIFEATVRSLSSLFLFRSKACCRQSSKLVQLWCSGRRCYNDDMKCALAWKVKGDTYRPTELGSTMWALPDDAESSRVALRVSVELELTAFLAGHGQRWR